MPTRVARALISEIKVWPYQELCLSSLTAGISYINVTREYCIYGTRAVESGYTKRSCLEILDSVNR